MLRPYDPTLMEAYAVNRAVNSIGNDTEQCIESTGEPSLNSAGKS
jgi:putative SOS response-associated peptidase YedK